MAGTVEECFRPLLSRLGAGSHPVRRAELSGPYQGARMHSLRQDDLSANDLSKKTFLVTLECYAPFGLLPAL